MVVIQRDAVVERVGSDPVTNEPKPKGNETQKESHKSTTKKEIDTKNTAEPKFLVDWLLEHRVQRNDAMQLKVWWDGPFEDTWEPRSNIS